MRNTWNAIVCARVHVCVCVYFVGEELTIVLIALLVF